MPKDPTKNIQSYQIQGGHVNEFEYQQSQGEMAHESESELPFETDKPPQTQAERVAEVTATAHRKVEKLRKRGLVKTPARKKPARKVARKPAKKAPQKATRKAAKQATKKVAKKAATRKGPRKRATVKSGRRSSSKKR